MENKIKIELKKKESNDDVKKKVVEEDLEIIKLDRRLQRLHKLKDNNDNEDNDDEPRRRRRFVEPEVIEEEPRESFLEADIENLEEKHAQLREKFDIKDEVIEDSFVEELKSESESSEEESSEEDSEEEDFFNSSIRKKPVFLRKEDRLSTINEKKKKEEELAKEMIKRKAAEDARKETLRTIEKTVKEEEAERNAKIEISFELINSVKTDDENEEVSYLSWKLRELKRNKRDKEERESWVKEKEDIERLRKMTEEERLEELKKNPKKITNQQEKGKYRFMQKYYHRGAFFMDQDEEIYKRNIANPTLEDHFDKTVLPKVMQVKNFGKSGRTKYTHLADQDTTAHDSPWYAKDSQQAKAFHEKHGAGMKQVFERPSKKRKN